MKIALAFPGVHRRAGVERVVAECARFLAGRGHDVHVFSNEYDLEPITNVQHHFVPARRRPGFIFPASFMRNCSAMLKPSEFDAYGSFGCDCPFGGVYWAQSVYKAWLEYRKAFRPPMSLVRWKQRLNPATPILLGQESKHFVGRRYRKVIALTADVKQDLKRFYNVPDADVEILPNGFAPDEFNPQRSAGLRPQMRKQLGYSESDRVVVFAANELERKGFAPLMRAIASLNDNALKLLVVGRVKPDAYQQEMDRLGISARVHFTGPTKDVATFYAAADVFALPTQYEAWGMVIVEAMACGLPALTSRLAGAAVAVREGETGALLDRPQDVEEIARKLKALLRGEHVNAAEISASVVEYGWDRILQKYETILMDAFAVRKDVERVVA